MNVAQPALPGFSIVEVICAKWRAILGTRAPQSFSTQHNLKESTMAKDKAARTPKAFPVGTRVKVHSLQKEGVVNSVPNFDERGVKLGKSSGVYPIGDLSEVTEESAS